MIGLGQIYAKRPVVRLALLRNRAFAAVFVLGLLIGAVLYGTSYVIPQFLAAIAGYNAQQAGGIVFLSGIPAGMMMPVFPLLVARLDLRLAVVTGMLLMMGSCWADTTLTAQSVGSDFYMSQLMRGLGQALSMLFLNQAAIASVKPSEAGDASGLFNAARNLGGSMALALLATLQDRRMEFHHWRLMSSITANGLDVQAWVASLTNGVGNDATMGALASVDRVVLREALVMSYTDEFVALAVAIALVLPLVLLLRPLPKGAHKVAMH